jgi:hypothetical protein
MCEGCEGSEASTEGTYQFGEHKTSGLREEIEENLIHNN